MNRSEPTITKKRLLEELEQYPDDFRISFGGLKFFKAKLYGEDLIHIEFNELVYLNEEGYVVVDNAERD